MANKRASISAHLRADATQWQRGCDTARAATDRLKRDVERTTINGPRANFMGISKGAAVAAVSTAGLAAAVSKVFTASIKQEQLIRSLAAVDRGTESLRTQMEELSKLAESPGVGSLSTAAQAAIALQSVGFEAAEARKAIAAFGNEAAVMGLPEEELQAVIVSLRQMAKAGVDMENLKEIFSRMPRLADMVEGIDKKDPLQFIRTLTDRLAQMPKAVGSAKEKIDGMKDAWDRLLAKANRIKTFLGSSADLGKAIFSGDRYGIGQGIKGLATDQMEEQDPLAKYEKTDAERAAIRRRIEAQEEKRANDKIIAGRKEQIRLLQQFNDEDTNAFNNGMAKANQDEEALRKLEAEQELVARINKLKELGHKIDEDVLDTLRKQAAKRLEEAAAIQQAAQHKKKTDEADQIKIERLRHMGRNRQADKEEDKQEVSRLMRDGMSKTDAEDLVRQRRELAQDQALGPGRRRLRRLRKPAPGAPETDRANIPIPDAENLPAKPGAPKVKPTNNNPRSKADENGGGKGGIFGDAANQVLKVLDEIRNNTKPRPSEAQQGIKRSQNAA